MQSQESSTKLRALKISAIAIFSVVVVEVVIGLLVNSLAVLSDGLHALLDVVSSVMLFFAARAALKPPDEEHTYGHEKFEAIGGLIAGIILIGVALLIFYEAGVRLMSNAQVNEGVEFAGFIAIGYTLCIDVVRITVFSKTRHIEGASVKAGFYDAISDFSSTLIALAGFGLATIGFSNMDSIASIFLGFMLTYLSVKLVKSSINELSDTASRDLVSKIKKCIHAYPDVDKIGNLKVRKVSSKIFVDATIQVPSAMSLEDAHTLASDLEIKLKTECGNVDATIHIEPSEKEVKLEQLVQKLASVEGVHHVHEISTVYVEGKLYITLHVYVNPALSVEEAHKIAEKIEQKIHAGIKHLENVTVHVEPSGVMQGVEADEEQVEQVVYEVARIIAQTLHVKRVVTYSAEGKRYINIDCCFTKQVKITEAHKMASQLEKETKEHFSNSVVTVHIEPERAD
ncbi:MAG: cation-efflux pump [Candidatus Bathyarchaeota archaeon]|nr:cation-efflux pump [Candidatus Bathyarchaeota archaeon]